MTEENQSNKQEPSSIPPAAEAASETKKAEEEEVGFKVFIGNLAFSTTEDEVVSFFSEAGKVLKANIIHRGTRSLGYGFVSFGNKDDAEKAVATLNKVEFGNRALNVELAKPKSQENNNETDPNDSRASGRRGSKSGNSRGRGRGPRKGRRDSRRRSTTSETAEAKPGDDSADKSETKTMTRSGRGRGRGSGGRRVGGRGRRSSRSSTGDKRAGGQGGGDGKDGNPARTAPSAPRKETREKTIESQYSLFVANLPFTLDDEGLKNLFKEYSVVSAYVVRRRGNGRSKGFGFVELTDKDEQKKALEGLKDLQTDGRSIAVKVALTADESSAAT